MKVKICATRSIEAAVAAYAAGADFIGMVFVPHANAHRIDRKTAQAIAAALQGKVQLVGVFENMPLQEVLDIIEDCQLDVAQFHGEESPEYLCHIEIKKIKAFRFAGEIDVQKARQQMQQFAVDYYLVDRFIPGKGSMLAMDAVATLAKEFPLFVAGGLTPTNVAEVIKKVHPFGVDVASGVETNGQQDLEKIQAFIKRVKGVVV